MNLLLDTHALIWFLNGSTSDLSPTARKAISDPANTSFVSIASLWEMAIKIRLGTLTFTPGYENLLALLDGNGFELLPVTFSHTRELLTLPMLRRDPFDRLLIAQSLVENMQLLTRDVNIHQYAVEWFW
ncbi:type II toxin-antitoxin system VapC family toxin [Spirosoma koreense]